MRTLGRLLLLVGAASVAFAEVPQVPEIDGATVMSAVALTAGGIMILRDRLRK